MIEEYKVWYKCQYCGNVSLDKEEIEKCEKNDLLINDKLKRIADACKELKELGCTISLREFPFYKNNEIDTEVIKRIYHNKDFELVFRDNCESSAIITREDM